MRDVDFKVRTNATKEDVIVTFHEDGHIEFGPKYTASEAAKAFWDSLADMHSSTYGKTIDGLRKDLDAALRRRDEALEIASQWRSRCDELRREVERLHELLK